MVLKLVQNINQDHLVLIYQMLYVKTNAGGEN